MSDPFDRLHQRLLARLGREALLRGGPVRVIVEQGVAVTGEYGQVTGFRSLVSIPSFEKPRGGDALVIGGEAFVIDAIERDDGHLTRCFVR